MEVFLYLANVLDDEGELSDASLLFPFLNLVLLGSRLELNEWVVLGTQGVDLLFCKRIIRP